MKPYVFRAPLLETLKQQAATWKPKARRINRTAKNMKAEIDKLENGWEMKCPL